MNKFFILLRAGLKSDLNFIDAGRFGKKAKSVNKAFSLILVVGMLAFLLGWLANTLITVLAPIGLGYLAITMMMVLASVVALISSVRKAQAVLFDSRDNDTLMAMPISKRTIFAVRVVRMIISQMFLTLYVLLPAVIVYGVRIMPPVGFYFLALLMVLILPLLPLAVGVGAGYLIRVIAAKFPKFQKILTLILSFVMVTGVAVFSILVSWGSGGGQEANDEQLMIDLANISGKMGGNYYPVRVFMDGMVKFDVMQFLILVVVSVVPIGILIMLGNKVYFKTISRLENRKIGEGGWFEAKKRGRVLALTRREIRRYFATPNYILNTFVVPVMQIIATVLIVIYRDSLIDGTNGVLAMYGLDELIGINLQAVLVIMAFIVVVLGGTMPGLACGVSLEGKKIEMLKALPMTAWEFCLGKILMALLLFALPAMGCLAVIGMALGFSMVNIICLSVAAGMSVMWINLFSLIMNLRFPKLNWKNEIEAIKQGAGLLISITVGFVMATVLIIVMIELFMLEPNILCMEAMLLTMVLTLVCGIVLKNYAAKKYKEISI